MPTLTVDFTSERPTYHLRRADGTEQRATARSRESAEAVISYYKFRGYTIKRKGHKMPLSKDQQREQRHRFVKALAQLQDTGTIKGSGSKNMIKSMERQGLVITHQGEAIDMTDAGRALLAEYDPPSATLIRNQAAESSDVSVAEPVEDVSLFDPSDLPWHTDDDGYMCPNCGNAYCAGDCWDTDEQQPEAETHLTLEELKNLYDVFGLADDQQPLPQPEQPQTQPQPDCKHLIRILWSVHYALAALGEYFITTRPEDKAIVSHLTVVSLIVNRALSDAGEGDEE